MKSFVVAVVVLLGGLVSGVRAEEAPKAKPGAPPACLSVTSTAQYAAYAYKHVTTLKNGCKADLACDVSTNVDPKPVHHVVVKKGKSVEVVTRNNSPVRAFTPNVSCK